MLRTRPDRGEHLLGRRGGEHEHDVCGRLFERLQQRVRRAGAQHVHFVDQVHLVRRRGTEAQVHALGEVAHRLDTVVRRGVELEEIEEAAVGDTDAVGAHTARVTVGACAARQLSALASRRAIVVLPVPRGPEKR